MDLVVGPIFPGKQTYVEEGVLKTTYQHAGGFAYAFEDNIVYKLEAKDLIPDQLFDKTFDAVSRINDVVINKNLLLQREVYVSEKWHPRFIDLVDHSCRVKLLLPWEEVKSGVASVLFRNCKTKKIVSPCRDFGTRADYFTLPRGCHDVIVLYNNATYIKTDSVELQAHSNVVAAMQPHVIHTADSLSRRWLNDLSDNCFRSAVVPARTFTVATSRRSNIGNVHGSIFDDMNMPIPGVAVVVKGTTIGTGSDVNGRFILDIPEDPSTLVISFIGYVTKEVEVKPGSEISIVMEPDIQQLQEVVVIGYSVSENKSLTGAVSMLGGRVSGVTISRDDSEDEHATEEKTNEPQTRAAEQQLYQELLMLKNIRTQFSDVAFWEPRLVTDRHGKSEFTITFPDDITRWDAVVYGMNRQLQTGTARKSIKSYKPLMAELHVPHFLTVGDSSDFMGKIVNYTSDKTIKGKTQWTGSTALETEVTFDGYHAEKRPVVAMPSDTIVTSYAFTRDDGYFDGERRKVPVVQQGTIRANGTLRVLQNDDTLRLRSKAGEVVKVEVYDNALEVYAGDVQFLVHYKYDCNEQLASKLIGLLNYKMIMQYEGKAFKHDKDINKIIQRLLKNQNSEFLWSWWDISSSTSYWMSGHILLALKAARDAGYHVDLDLNNVARKATYKYEMLSNISISDLEVIHALAMWNVDIDYAKYVNDLDKYIQYDDSVARAYTSRYGYSQYSRFKEKLMLLEIRQLQSLPFVRDSLLQYRKRTIFDEVYFSDGKSARRWYSGDLSSNTIAYRIIGRDSSLHELKMPMQMYFLSLRRKERWNTYEASNVIMSILPDVIGQGSTKKVPASILVSGKVNRQVTTFPYKTELAEGQELSMRKETGMPLYCMAYKEERVVKAQAGTDAFAIKTMFDERSLKAGKPAILKATVEVRRDAKLEHVMIEIPIPGGCSYADKRQFNNRIETHREYFKDKTVIFCENMTPGAYVFQVQLLPRFTGKYFVNPAQVSLMYFPVINANTDMEKVVIAE
jgi:hypothetical protein